MPQNNKKNTLQRQWEMMRMLTVSRADTKQDGRWDKASDITAKLNDAGYDVSVRTVQRDLKELSEIFPIVAVVAEGVDRFPLNRFSGRL